MKLTSLIALLLLFFAACSNSKKAPVAVTSDAPSNVEAIRKAQTPGKYCLKQPEVFQVQLQSALQKAGITVADFISLTESKEVPLQIHANSAFNNQLALQLVDAKGGILATINQPIAAEQGSTTTVKFILPEQLNLNTVHHFKLNLAL